MATGPVKSAYRSDRIASEKRVLCMGSERLTPDSNNHPAIPTNTNALARTLTAIASHAMSLGGLALPRLRLINTTIAIEVETGVTVTNQAANTSAISNGARMG